MSKLKLEVGKKYVCKNRPDIKYVEITEIIEITDQRYIGYEVLATFHFIDGYISYNHTYTIRGTFFERLSDDRDLVAEYVEEHVDDSNGSHVSTTTTENQPVEEVKKAKRSNSGKIRPSMFSPVAMLGAARVGEFGCTKYSLNNWRDGEGLDVLDILDSMARHLIKFSVGLDNDEESKLPNVDHITWNAMALAEQFHMGKMKRDSRYINKEMAEAVLRILDEWKVRSKEESKK